MLNKTVNQHAVGRRIESIRLLMRVFSLQRDRLQKLRNDYPNVAIYGFDLRLQALRLKLRDYTRVGQCVKSIRLLLP